MNGRHMNSGLGKVAAGLLAALTCGLMPQAASAGWLGYYNDTKSAVIVQGSSVINGMEYRGTPHQINPRESAWDQLLQPGTKSITIYEARPPNKVLFKTTIEFKGADLYYSIQSDGTMGGLKLVPMPFPKKK